MEAEQMNELSDSTPDIQDQRDVGIEKVLESKLDTPGYTADSDSPFKSGEQTLNGHDAEQSPMNGEEDKTVITESDKTRVRDSDMETEEDKSPKEIAEEAACAPEQQFGCGDQVVTETLPEEGNFPEDKPPAPGREPENVSDSIPALNSEPENIQIEWQPLAEKSPEPLPLDEPLPETAAVPEPEPEKEVESVTLTAGLSEQALSESLTQMTLEEGKPLDEVEEVAEQLEKQGESVKMEIQLEGDEVIKEVLVEVKPQKTAEQEIVAQQTVEAAHLDVGMEEPVVALKEIEVEKAGVTDAVAEKAAVADAVAQVEVEKPVQAAAEKVLEKATAVESEVEKAEQQQPEEVEEEEEEEEHVPTPGSLSFALLDQEKTKATLQSSRTLVVLQGLPGSGKSLLARAIADSYQELCTVVSADDHGVKLDSPEASVEGYKALDNAVEACCRSTTAASMIVVDDTNHTHERLALFGELAEEHRLVVMFLEPRTEWRRDLPKLVKKSHRGLEEAKIQAIQGSLEETSLPLFFGWFLLPNVQDKVRCTSLDFLKQLDTLEAFKKHLADFTGQGEKEVDLEQYFQVKGALHCTTKFCDYGKAEGAVEYAEMPAVQKEYGSVFELSLTALFVTPRTVGARVSLTADQLVLWPADAEKQAEPAVPAAASLPLGSRAHVTLGCAEGVEPVQTGLDLLEILALQEDGQQGEPVEEMELGGSLTYYGKGRWMLSLKEPVSAQACFSSLYARKKPEEGKKEAEKRKKPKCVIL